MVQGRLGTRRCRFFMEFYNQLHDGIKLIFKRINYTYSLLINFLFILAPIITFALSYLWLVLLFHSNERCVFADLNLWSFIYFFVLVLYLFISIILGGWSSNSHHSFLRCSSSYSSNAILWNFYDSNCLLQVLWIISKIVEYQDNFWLMFPLFPQFIMFIISILAETC
jgi:NADH-quinone oxidoreductase subunit H